jgi:uncharacterized integral membrane protein
MTSLRRLLTILLLLALAVTLFQNQEALGLSVQFAFLKWHFSLVLGFWLLFAFVAGALLFAAFDAWRDLRHGIDRRRRDRETDARIEALRAEIERLKSGKDAGGAPR